MNRFKTRSKVSQINSLQKCQCLMEAEWPSVSVSSPSGRRTSSLPSRVDMYYARGHPVIHRTRPCGCGHRPSSRLMWGSIPFYAQRCRTSVYGIMSCHLMLAMRLRQRTWNWSSLRTCCRWYDIKSVWCPCLTALQQCW